MAENRNKNTLGCGGTLPYIRWSKDAIGMNSGSCNPFYINQADTSNLISTEGHQTDYGVSQPGFSEFKKHLNSGLCFGASSGHHAGFLMQSGSLSYNGNVNSVSEQKISFNEPNDTGVITRKLTGSTLGPYNVVRDSLDGGYGTSPNAHLQAFAMDAHQVPLKEVNDNPVDNFPIHNYKENYTNHINEVPHMHRFDLAAQYGPHINVAVNNQSLGFESEDCPTSKNALESSLHDDEVRELKKLDSFGRWMNKEIGGDCNDPLMASESCSYWSTLDTNNDNKEVSSLLHHMQLDVGSMGPSLSQDQLFSILDFSPDWAYSGTETKVLISGTFLSGIKHPSSIKWCCMFGEVEVPAEVLITSVLRCQAPVHAPGRVPFYITCSDRLACSEVREFEYRENPTFSIATKSKPEDEMCLQIRLAKMLFLGVERKWLDCSKEKCEKCSLHDDRSSKRNDDENEWGRIETALKALDKNCENPRDALLQKFLKDRLHEWLVCKAHEEGKGQNVLDDEGQGVIHLAAALGYEWAMSPIVAAGVSPSFRDARGRTGLHWAAYFGREETVVTLVRLGAAPGAVEDPTSKFPEGRTAADLASSRGHKGIAGYLAKADLISQLSSLELKESVMDTVSATLAGDKAVKTVQEQSINPIVGENEDLLSLRGPLAAVRSSAQAAARIQAAFHVHSYRQRQLTKSSDEDSEISSELMVLASLNKAQKVDHFSDSMHGAAVGLQQKYRGWKGRKEFLKIRNHIVKIQAHVGEHQVRKQYKKVVWSVSIVEKAILRWRRKRTGLQGFRASGSIGNAELEIGEEADEYEYLHVSRGQKLAGVEKALARVQSMVHYREARDQYMRLVAADPQKSKMGDEEDASSDGFDFSRR
ncbi:calmodulin-binding transcription activator 2-like isoform X2 [Magnolia sinica]|uniref:calmodulin-binding transcription activator 2-like isoform X2 n=1 Tax=Magnolia sinica TaxID=86752 RepID=UPI00265B4BA7|nr:calmodulin-binding transcription activator 2-like isoform X2 [Magnolia sinica]